MKKKEVLHMLIDAELKKVLIGMAKKDCRTLTGLVAKVLKDFAEGKERSAA